ncbi:MAG: hypothetical protein K8M05_08010, partial [Deltaproteobacteria bacterium]|nr:hypothetical protein [Kofleriaceae bacterium]
MLLTTALLALHATTAHATDDAAVAKSKLGSLPGLQLLDATGLEVAATSPGYTVRGLDRAFVATVFRGDTGWLGALELKRPGGFALDELRDVGSISVTTAIFVVAEADGALTSAQLPVAIRRDLADFLVGGKLPVAKGVNLFVAGAPG